jgi:hypothetical protein
MKRSIETLTRKKSVPKVRKYQQNNREAVNAYNRAYYHKKKTKATLNITFSLFLMTTTIYSSSSWFYDRDSTTLFVNEDTQKVGINNDSPQYELQVDGTIYATTYSNLPSFAQHTLVSNEIYPIAKFGSNTSVYGSNVATWSSNNLVKNSNIVGVSNLSTSNVNSLCRVFETLYKETVQM